ncbi:MAG: methylenetetrahydrofolate reductase [NAD(P)H] [Rhodospirillaceae bacterium]|nr:methylenetetrahydrofolate reductase [NAD(P)H] [Rhodospirillaceae bacterium]
MNPPLKLSFEFFPPATDRNEAALWRTVEALTSFGPRFVSVTYGAGGSTRARTDRIVRAIKRDTGLEPAAHLTCVGAVREEVDAIAKGWWEAGIRHLVALRGDPPKDADRYTPHPGGYENAAALVAGLRRVADFDIAVAAYPECHPDSPSPEAVLDNLKRKLEAGAGFAITQFFFEPATFLRFRDRACAAGIEAPIVPGILPITNFARAVRFAGSCGATVPAWLAELYRGLDDDPETRSLVAAAQATELCQRLQAEGVEAFHFYTLNRPALTAAICRRLSVRAPLEEAA